MAPDNIFRRFEIASARNLKVESKVKVVAVSKFSWNFGNIFIRSLPAAHSWQVLCLSSFNTIIAERDFMKFRRDGMPLVTNPSSYVLISCINNDCMENIRTSVPQATLAPPNILS
jgi:hypothetical protein